jgi:hypothetical protein
MSKPVTCFSSHIKHCPLLMKKRETGLSTCQLKFEVQRKILGHDCCIISNSCKLVALKTSQESFRPRFVYLQ